MEKTVLLSSLPGFGHTFVDEWHYKSLFVHCGEQRIVGISNQILMIKTGKLIDSIFTQCYHSIIFGNKIQFVECDIFES